MSANSSSDPIQLVWFKRDLRTVDHRPLAKASVRGPVLPLFIVEPDLWRQPDYSARQWDFVRECLEELQADLAALGQPLVIRSGAAVDVLNEIHNEFGVAALWSHEETGNGWTFERDIAVARWCRERSVPWHEEQQGGVIRRLASRDGWARKWNGFMAEPVTQVPEGLTPLPRLQPGPVPTRRDLRLAADDCAHRQVGGRAAARARLERFLRSDGETYRRAMSGPSSGAAACSRLSPHLAWGTVSMREVAQATSERRRELKGMPRGSTGGWRGSLTSFSGRLHWRCHFMQKFEDEPDIEHRNLHSAYEGLRPPAADETLLAAWAGGETGWPFVDACMRALAATGWMNFRMRAMLMSVASYHLWLDWRKPGEHLARLFTDYEPGIHWPQVQMQSGTTGINTARIYNPVKQGHDQEPDGRFIRQWVPELAEVPDAFIHEPWTWEDAGRVLGRAYPFPVVDHLDAAKAARRKIWSVRRGPEFREEADRIQAKHGSRKSGMPITGRRRQKPKQEQLKLSL